MPVLPKRVVALAKDRQRLAEVADEGVGVRQIKPPGCLCRLARKRRLEDPFAER